MPNKGYKCLTVKEEFYDIVKGYYMQVQATRYCKEHSKESDI